MQAVERKRIVQLRGLFMKKIIYIAFLIGLFTLAGCQTDTEKSNLIMDINGTSMISAKDASLLLGLTYSVENGSIVLKQDHIVLRIKLDTPYVYKDGYIMYMMEKPAVCKNDIAYLTSSFFSDYFKVDIKSDKKKHLLIINSTDFSLYDIAQFLPEEVLEAINNKDYPNRDKILKQVELPRSMNILIPKINMDRVIVTTPLSKYSDVFKNELIQHGYTEKEIATFSLNDYRVIERSWKLPEEMVKRVKRGYPELENRDMGNWTYGDYQKYYTKQDKANFESSFTEKQKTQLIQRGILMEDVHLLLKDYYKIDIILVQSDEILKKTLEEYYQFTIDMLKAKNGQV